jgi:small subunit ribosomal protein S17
METKYLKDHKIELEVDMTRNIGLKVKEPSRECDDRNCPFHGGLSIRGKLFNGKVTGNKARQTITLQKDAPIYFNKFKRYARGKSTIHAHVPRCIDVESGDTVVTAECKPISKSVSFVVVEVKA